ncbi:MAG: metallophosphoesterase [Acidimicrobiaceae bacterium]|nr:metallophosphoesterase [Acidimicrobiaceae bacterium]
MRRWEPYEFTTDRSWDDASELAEGTVTDVLVVGDVHGNTTNLAKAIDQAVDLGVGAIVQVGDFWLADVHWSRLNPLECEFMWTAHDSAVPIVVLDGNHEVWPALGRYALTETAQAVMASRRPLHLGGSIWWAWRGSTWQWGGCSFGALGGAVSPDRWDLAVRGFRWSDEATTEDDLQRLINNTQAEFGGELDVLFTHDAPAQVQNLKSAIMLPPDLQHAAEEVRRLLAEAVEHTDPAYVLHGHWHQYNHEQIVSSTEVFGLSADGIPNSTALLTTRPALDVTYTT